MTQLGRRFSLSESLGTGVSCGENGPFIGEVPLLECSGSSGMGQWRPRPVPDLNRELSKRYGLPVELQAKIGGLEAVARALDRRDLLTARITTLHLEFPDPPALAKSSQSTDQINNLARQLKASGLLKADWDPEKHPRWPAGSPDSVGGEFAPKGGASEASVAPEATARAIPAQVEVPFLPELAIPRGIPLPRGVPFPQGIPQEIMPGPFAPPTIIPRDELRNPYPDRPECEEEWADALAYCWKLMTRKQLGRGDYRGSGKTFRKCVMGRVSERCGGNSTEA